MEALPRITRATQITHRSMSARPAIVEEALPLLKKGCMLFVHHTLRSAHGAFAPDDPGRTLDYGQCLAYLDELHEAAYSVGSSVREIGRRPGSTAAERVAPEIDLVDRDKLLDKRMRELDALSAKPPPPPPKRIA